MLRDQLLAICENRYFFMMMMEELIKEQQLNYPYPLRKVRLDISFTIDDFDEESEGMEIYHFDPGGKEYSLAPGKGSAMIKISQ